MLTGPLRVKSGEEIVSVIGDAYLEPISELTKKLTSLQFSQNEVQASMIENGYSVSLCILIAAWFESWVVRVRYLNSISEHVAIKPPVDFLYALYPDLPIYQELTEVFVLRDSLVHNHLWFIEMSWGGASGMNLRKARKDAFYGDKKYRKYVDSIKRETQKLRLNVVPIKVCTSDFKTVLGTVWRGLEFMRDKDPTHLGIGNVHVNFGGQWIPVRRFVAQILRLP